MLLSARSLFDIYRMHNPKMTAQPIEIIQKACTRVILTFQMIARYLLRVISVIDKIDIARVDMIIPTEAKQPFLPDAHPSVLKTKIFEENMYKLKIISAQHRLRTNKVSTDLFRTRNIEAMTRVPNKIPKKSRERVTIPKRIFEMRYSSRNLK